MKFYVSENGSHLTRTIDISLHPTTKAKLETFGVVVSSIVVPVIGIKIAQHLTKGI